MNCNRRYWLIVPAAFLLAFAVSLPAMAADGVVVQEDELVVICQDNLEACAMPGEGYTDLQVGTDQATFRIEGYELPAGKKRLVGHGIKRVSWEPGDGSTTVTIDFDRAPGFNLANAVDGTELRPQTPQVIIGFGFDPPETRRSYPVLGSRGPGEKVETDAHGTFELPEMPPVKYSDALVTLDVRNADFREVLWFMSAIGGVSIVLDPYWDQEPTGNRRPVGGGVGGTPGGGGDGGPGFRPAGEFIPMVPRNGTGNLTMNLQSVPFDLALDLILITVGLVKVDIYPGSFDT